MANRTQAGCLFFVLAAGLAGCDGDRAPGLLAPSPGPQPTPIGINLAGTVLDTAWRPLAGARVEVVSGPQAGLSTTADANGGYRLTGAFDDTTQFRATKEGHVAATRPLPPSCAHCTPQHWLHFYLGSLTPHVNIAGDYTLTIIAGSGCASLPDDVRTRTYEATVTAAPHPSNSQFDVAVTGSTLLEHFDGFTIGVAGEYLAAEIGDGHGSPGLVEQIAPNTYLTLGGSIATNVTAASTISLSLYGLVDRCVLTTAWGSARYSCTSGEVITHAQCGPTAHQLTLTRR